MIHSVYWIHLPEHTDMFDQGYIGVSYRPTDRLYEHVNYEGNAHLTNAVNKYGSQIIQSIILVGSKEYCYGIEEKLRPSDHIGWNISKGGGHPPSWKGREKTAEHRANISRAKTGKPRSDTPWNKGLRIGAQSEEHRSNISKGLTGRKLSEQDKLNKSIAAKARFARLKVQSA
ncbi:MAG: hypothetical protein ACXV2C_08260 [Candidatus Bathyarchaeia archaeon]